MLLPSFFFAMLPTPSTQPQQDVRRNSLSPVTFSWLSSRLSIACATSDDTASVPIIPHSLACALYRFLFEVPPRNAREASVEYKDKFCTSKNVAKSWERYELTGVVLGFSNGKTSLKTLIQIIDIALGEKEGRLSRNKLATIRCILEACYKEREDSS